MRNDPGRMLIRFFSQSDLEFKLRLQQMIELSRADQTLEARQHLQKYLMPQYSEHTQDVNKAIALLAIPPSIRCKRYEVSQIHETL